MRIGHIAIWTQNLEEMKEFYTTYFGGVSNEKYINSTKGFESYFIKFDGETTLELMRRKDVTHKINIESLGLCHLAFTIGTQNEVLALTERFRANGYKVIGEPRTSGDGYFESVILDIDGNRVELIAE